MTISAPVPLLRSLLFVPGDRPDRFGKALASGADALILDLEDAVARSEKPRAREHVAAFLKEMRGEPKRPRLIVRINGLDTGLADDDLDAACATAPDAILLPKALGGASIAHLDAKLAVREATHGHDDGVIHILALATELSHALFAAGSYMNASPRLRALIWGVEDLSADIGARMTREPDGAFTPPFQLARSLCLFAAHAAKVAALDTVYADFRDRAGFERECRVAWRDGFAGKLAIHPDQVPIINEVFMPDAQEIAWARSVVAAFAANPQAGALQLDGRMIDQPHLIRAQRILAQTRLSD